MPAVRVSGCPTEQYMYDGLYTKCADDHDGMPRYVKEGGGSHLYYYETRLRWFFDNLFSPDSDACSAYIESKTGELPSNQQTWTCFVDAKWTERAVTVALLNAAALEQVQHNQLVEQLVSRCECDADVARVQLERCGWELERAVASHQAELVAALEQEQRQLAALEAGLRHLMHHKENAQNPSCLAKTFAQSGYKESYDRCARPRDGADQWADPLTTVKSCLPQAFDLSEWDDAVAHAGADADLERAGTACARLWSAGPVGRLINQVIMADNNYPQLDRMMPFIRCFNDFLLSGGELPAALTVYRSSRLTAEQAADIDTGTQYRIGMYVATSTNKAVTADLQGWQAGEAGFAPKVKWVFTIPARCRQVMDISSVSAYGNEDEVTMVPYTAIRVDSKDPDVAAGRTTIHATVLRDAFEVSEALPTILA
jgi:hypothetical protein